MTQGGFGHAGYSGVDLAQYYTDIVDSTGDFNMNMNASGAGNRRGWGRAHDRFAYQGYGYPYAYAPYGAHYP